MADDDWLDVEAAARLLGLPQRSVLRLIYADALAASGPPWRIQRDNLTSFIERSRLHPGQLPRIKNAKAFRPAPEPRINQDGTVDRRFGPRHGGGR